MDEVGQVMTDSGGQVGLSSSENGQEKGLNNRPTRLSGRNILLPDAPSWMRGKHKLAAEALSMGLTQAQAGEAAGVSERTVFRWLHEKEWSQEFQGYVDKATFTTGLAQRSERLRVAKRLAQKRIQQEIEEGKLSKRHDLIDTLRYVKEESGDRTGLPENFIVTWINELFQVNVGGVQSQSPWQVIEAQEDEKSPENGSDGESDESG